MQRVTLDSNQYISALNFGGLPLRVLNLAVAGEIEIVISEPIIAEVLRVLKAFSLLTRTGKCSEVRLFLRKSRAEAGCPVYTRSENA